MLRKAAVAGEWYPDNPRQLAAEIDGYVSDAGAGDVDGVARAIIAPHAGLRYSGPVAAFAYRAVRGAAYRAAVLVGPSHFVPFRGVSIWPAGEWETPFGPVAIDEALAASIHASCSDIGEIPAAHGREHSLEMQLPFLARLLPGVPIVPLVMGQQTRTTAFALGAALARSLAGQTHTGPHEPDVLLVASSDLSHYEDARRAAQMDAVMLQHVEALDPDALMGALEHEPGHACGGGPMVAVLMAAAQLGASRARVLRYADSGDVSGDKSSVVGYMAAAVW